MSRRITLLSLRTVLLTLVAAGITSQAVAQAPVRIMPLGDSITAGPGCWRAISGTACRRTGTPTSTSSEACPTAAAATPDTPTT